MARLTGEDVREIFRGIAAAVGTSKERGEFLTAFARAMVQADPENFLILMPAAMRLLLKYELLQLLGMEQETNAEVAKDAEVRRDQAVKLFVPRCPQCGLARPREKWVRVPDCFGSDEIEWFEMFCPKCAKGSQSLLTSSPTIS